MVKDLTKGNPSAVLWKFCLPLFGSVIFQQLYNIADSFVAGKYINEDALAAVGNSYEITLIFIAFAFGCNIGCSVIVSQLFGSKNYRDLKTAVSTTWISCGVLCVVLMALGWIFCQPLLKLINTPDSIMAQSALYLNIYIAGLPFMFYYNVSNGIFSALGNSGTPFIFLVCSSLANIGADILFVTVFNMKIEGVAWATFICQGISCIISVIVVLKHLGQIKSEKYVKFSGKIFKKIAAVAVPSVLQQSFISVGNILIQGKINSFGTPVIAGYSAAIKLNNLVITSFTTMGNGISNYTAQNFGAQKGERISSGYRAGIKMVMLISIPIAIIYFVFGEPLVRIFMNNPTVKAVDTGIMFLKIVSPFYLLISAKIVSDGILRGAGLMKRFIVTTFSDLILRVLLAFVLSESLSTTGIWISWPIGWAVATVLSVAFCLSFLKNKIYFPKSVQS